MRKTKGREIDAACGQLRSVELGTGDDGGRDDRVIILVQACRASTRRSRRGRVVATEALEQQLEAKDPDVRLMLQVRDDVQGRSRCWSSVISIGCSG